MTTTTQPLAPRPSTIATAPKAKATSLEGMDIIHGEVKNCGVDSIRVEEAIARLIESGLTKDQCCNIAELIFAVYSTAEGN